MTRGTVVALAVIMLCLTLAFAGGWYGEQLIRTAHSTGETLLGMVCIAAAGMTALFSTLSLIGLSMEALLNRSGRAGWR